MDSWQIFGAVTAVYILIVMSLRLIFRSVFYRPWRFEITPTLCDVDDVELVDIHPSADQRLLAWHHRPTKEGAPVLVFFDGVRGNVSLWNRRWRRIAASGAGFIALSYRGYGGSTGRPSEKGMHEDAQLTWAWASKQYPADQLALHGYSMGTVFASKLATELPEVPVILEGAPISVMRRFQELVPILPAAAVVADSLSVRESIEKIKGPLLIVHGKKDRVVPPRHARKLFALARTPNKKIEWVAGANHINLSVNGLYPLIWSFLAYKPLDAPEDPHQMLLDAAALKNPHTGQHISPF